MSPSGNTSSVGAADIAQFLEMLGDKPAAYTDSDNQVTAGRTTSGKLVVQCNRELVTDLPADEQAELRDVFGHGPGRNTIILDPDEIGGFLSWLHSTYPQDYRAAVATVAGTAVGPDDDDDEGDDDS